MTATRLGQIFELLLCCDNRVSVQFVIGFKGHESHLSAANNVQPTVALELVVYRKKSEDSALIAVLM